MSPDEKAPKGIPSKRSARRLPLTADIHVRKSGYKKTGVVLLDMSRSGCRVELPERVGTGETVWVTFPGLQSIEAQVAWVDKWIAGLQFVNPIHPSVFDHIVPKIRK